MSWEISAAVAAQVIHGRGAGGEEVDESLNVVAVLVLFTENRKVAEDEFFGLGADRDNGEGEGLWRRHWGVTAEKACVGNGEEQNRK